MHHLNDRVAVVTGAGGGIGRATALALAVRGCRLALSDISEGPLADTARAVAIASGRQPSRHICDVGDRDAVGALANDVVDEHGAAHILVNNAGVTMAGRFGADSLDDLRWMVDINLWGVVNGCHAFLPHLRHADEGHIVNLSSMVGLVGLPGNAGYALTKGAVRSFSESLRGELRTDGVGVTAVFPGAIDTDIIQAARGTSVARLQRAQAMSPRLRRWVLTSPDRVAQRIIGAIEHDRARVTVGPDARALDLFTRIVPGRSGLIGRLMARLEEDPVPG